MLSFGGRAEGTNQGFQILPIFALAQMGRGTMRRMVEGAAAQPPLTRRNPSVSPSGCHLPIWLRKMGRISKADFTRNKRICVASARIAA